MSRQRRWQLKMRKQGRCIMCGKDAGGAQRCEAHKLRGGAGSVLYDATKRREAKTNGRRVR